MDFSVLRQQGQGESQPTTATTDGGPRHAKTGRSTSRHRPVRERTAHPAGGEKRETKREKRREEPGERHLGKEEGSKERTEREQGERR